MMADRNWWPIDDGAAVCIRGRYGAPDMIIEGSSNHEIRIRAGLTGDIFIDARDLAEALAYAARIADVNLVVVDADDDEVVKRLARAITAAWQEKSPLEYARAVLAALKDGGR